MDARISARLAGLCLSTIAMLACTPSDPIENAPGPDQALPLPGSASQARESGDGASANKKQAGQGRSGQQRPAIGRTADMAVDRENRALYLLEHRQGGLQVVDLDTGDRETVSNGPRPMRNKVLGGRGLVIHNDRLFLLTGKPGVLFSVDPDTGERTRISDPEGGDGPVLESPTALTIDGDGDRALVANTYDGLVEIDLHTGKRRILKKPSGDEFSLGRVKSMHYNPGSGQLLFLQPQDYHLVSLDIESGQKSMVSENTPVNGVSAGMSASSTLDTAKNRVFVVAANDRAVLSIDLDTGERKTISTATSNPELPFYRARTSALDGKTNQVLVSDQYMGAILGANIATGDRSILSGTDNGNGPSLKHAVSMVVDHSNDRALVASRDLEAILSVDLASGDRRELSGTVIGNGPGLDSPVDLGVHRSRNKVFVFEHEHRSLIAIDGTSGDREILSGPETGAGPRFSTVLDLVVDEPRDRAIIRATLLERDASALMEVSLDTGNTRIISGPRRGLWPEVRHEGSMALDRDGSRVFVPGRSSGAIIEVDLETGEHALIHGDPDLRSPEPGISSLSRIPGRNQLLVQQGKDIRALDPESGEWSEVSNNDRGRGPLPHTPLDSGWDTERQRILLLDKGRSAVVAVDPASGDRTFLSSIYNEPDGD